MYTVISIFITYATFSLVEGEVIHDPTITADPSFSALSAAETIYKELYQELTTNRDKLVDIIFHLTADQRIQLYNAFGEKYTYLYRGRIIRGNLLSKLKVESTGNMNSLYSVAFMSSQALLAKAVCDTIDGRSDDHKAVNEVICAQDNQMKTLIEEYYLATYNIKLEDHFKKYKSDDGPYQEAMMKYCWPKREEKLKIDDKVANDEAKALKELLGDKEKFKGKLKEFLGKYTEADLKLIFQKYRDEKRGIDNDVDDVFTGNEKEAYGTLVRYIENTCKYYADALEHAVEDGFGKTDINRINRITLTRCERDMMRIANTYKDLHGKTFTQRLKSDLTAEDRYLECIRFLCGKK